MISILEVLVLSLLAVFLVIVLGWKGARAAAFVFLGVLSLFALLFVFRSISHQRAVPTARFGTGLIPADQATGLKIVQSEDAKAIWLPGIENEFKANKYPSKFSALRSLGLRIDKPIRQLLGDQPWPDRAIVFQGGHTRDLLDEFVNTAAGKFTQIEWTVAPETVAVEPNQVGIRLDLSAVQSGPTPWNKGNPAGEITRGTIRTTIMAGSSQISISADFEEKPWIEDFHGVWNSSPDKRLIVARSNESCLTEAEANSQAIADACNQLTTLLRQTSHAHTTPRLPRNVTSNDILEGDFIVDRFAQNFDGRAGKIWRQALLIDASVGKLEDLAHHKTALARTVRLSWARMIGSVVGLLTLITVVYAFLNAATRGYYTWSLRIACIVLAAAVIILFIA